MAGKPHHRARDLTGQKLGYLTAIRWIGANGKKSIWECRCECGAIKNMEASEFVKQQKRGILASCGCMRGATIGKKQTRHGMTRHPAYAVWRSMMDRCRLPTHQAWHNYGARGISVCERWQECFENFWEDMGPTYRKGMDLNRRDNNGNYTPENCRWHTRRKNSNNRRLSRHVVTPLGRMTIAQASRRYGIKYSTLLYRLDHGWDSARALTSTT